MSPADCVALGETKSRRIDCRNWVSSGIPETYSELNVMIPWLHCFCLQGIIGEERFTVLMQSAHFWNFSAILSFLCYSHWIMLRFELQVFPSFSDLYFHLLGSYYCQSSKERASLQTLGLSLTVSCTYTLGLPRAHTFSDDRIVRKFFYNFLRSWIFSSFLPNLHYYCSLLLKYEIGHICTNLEMCQVSIWRYTSNDMLQFVSKVVGKFTGFIFGFGTLHMFLLTISSYIEIAFWCAVLYGLGSGAFLSTFVMIHGKHVKFECFALREIREIVFEKSSYIRCAWNSEMRRYHTLYIVDFRYTAKLMCSATALGGMEPYSSIQTRILRSYHFNMFSSCKQNGTFQLLNQYDTWYPYQVFPWMYNTVNIGILWANQNVPQFQILGYMNILPDLCSMYECFRYSDSVRWVACW